MTASSLWSGDLDVTDVRGQTFHTDTFCDILSLQTRNLAVEGGRNLLSSSWTIYNKLKASRPDVVELLAEPIWPFDRYVRVVVLFPNLRC